ncbi:hypothetical protein [Hymenobacter cheonanensis]|uniref:hypothetical protein n=1 Tax=Hymenobacter sp. CA2-7 TaxID=3063993 RepID=UPI0027123781|nr:hypothetical protein [Hymenobacter sp. CA2-7]MDO7885703.1 hypothetical protein [Hymenobacter sp. CA2-7]
MAAYAFVTPEFGLDETGLHRLRSRFAFAHIPYAAMSRVEVTRGRSVQNWWLLLAFGLACLGVGLWTAVSLYLFLTSPRPEGRVDVRAVATPLIPTVLGMVAIWQALRVEEILVVYYGKRSLVLPLSNLKTGSAAELRHYLAQRTAAGKRPVS